MVLCVFLDLWDYVPTYKRYLDMIEVFCFLVIIGLAIQSKISRKANNDKR